MNAASCRMLHIFLMVCYSCKTQKQQSAAGLRSSPTEMLWLKVTAVSLLVGLALCNEDLQLQNDLLGDLSFECKSGHGLYRVAADYGTSGGGVGDRLWGWECRKIDIWSKTLCEWFEGINTPAEPIYFMCPSDAFMAGVRSTHDQTSDRTWDIKCCRIKKTCMEHCELTDVVITPGVDILTPPYSVSREDGVMVAFHGDYFASFDDHGYRFVECKFDTCPYPIYKKKKGKD